MKARLKELTGRNNGMGNKQRIIAIQRFVKGWVNYFKIANMKRHLETIDMWMRRRIRMIYWKQWKNVRTRYRELRKLGLRHKLAIKYANTRKSYWRISNSPILAKTLTNKLLRIRGYIPLSDYYHHVKLS
jgi:hypothetical protein